MSDAVLEREAETTTEAAFNGRARKPRYITVYKRPGANDIKVENLHVHTPGMEKILLDDLTYTVNCGDRIVLTGENGSGKTTVAKALLNQWDYGSGKVGIPDNMSVMTVSQKPFFPNTTLRGILNGKPDEHPVYDDSELTWALQEAGHDRLIQHIPGQQVNILVDELLEGIERKLPMNTAKVFSDHFEDEFESYIQSVVPKMVAEQFDIVQFVTPDAKEHIREKLNTVLDESEAVDACTDRLADEIDRALTKPLLRSLEDDIERLAAKKRGWLAPLTQHKIEFMAGSLEKQLGRYLDSYMANDDTDDKHRPIRINEFQARYVSSQVARRFIEESSQYKAKGALAKLFNILTAPISYALQLRWKAGSAALDLKSAITHFMSRQVVTGAQFEAQLSGGEKQRLMFAKIFLQKPDFLIADEITAALDVDTGEHMYAKMMDILPDTSTVISIAHNPHIRKYHCIHGHLANRDITFKPVEQSDLQTASP